MHQTTSIFNPTNGYSQTTTTKPLTEDVSLIVKINREPIIQKGKFKFKLMDSEVYLTKGAGQYYLKHKYNPRSNKISVEHFSFWLTLDILNLNDGYDYDSLFDNLEMDNAIKIEIN